MAYLKRSIKEFHPGAPHSTTTSITSVPESEIVPGHAKYIGQWRDPSAEAVIERLELKVGDLCPCGEKFFELVNEIYHTGKHSFHNQVYYHWTQGHFDIPIYEEIT